MTILRYFSISTQEADRGYTHVTNARTQILADKIMEILLDANDDPEFEVLVEEREVGVASRLNAVDHPDVAAYLASRSRTRTAPPATAVPEADRDEFEALVEHLRVDHGVLPVSLRSLSRAQALVVHEHDYDADNERCLRF